MKLQMTKSKRFISGFTILISILFIAGCFEGFVGINGGHLRAYITPQALYDLITEEPPQDDVWIIDVRSTLQYDLGHIPTARSFPSDGIMDRLDELPLDQDIIVYCESGIRAQAVINNLIAEGYTRLMNWGSVTRWIYELETES